MAPPSDIHVYSTSPPSAHPHLPQIPPMSVRYTTLSSIPPRLELPVGKNHDNLPPHPRRLNASRQFGVRGLKITPERHNCRHVPGHPPWHLQYCSPTRRRNRTDYDQHNIRDPKVPFAHAQSDMITPTDVTALTERRYLCTYSRQPLGSGASALSFSVVARDCPVNGQHSKEYPELGSSLSTTCPAQRPRGPSIQRHNI